MFNGLLLTHQKDKPTYFPFEAFTPTFSTLPASLILVEQTVCKICKEDNENETIHKPAYNFYQVLAIGVCTLPDTFLEAGKQDNETPTHDKEKQVIVYFDEVNQKIIYLDFELLQKNFRLIDYAFHQDLNEAFQDSALPFAEYLESVVFHVPMPLALRNMAWYNTKNRWEFMNGKMQHKEYLDFSEII